MCNEYQRVYILKIVLIGHKDHGKDEVADMLVDVLKEDHNIDITFKTTSEIANEEFIFDCIKDEFDYKTLKEAHTDRDNHRPLWFRLISLFNRNNKAEFIKLVLSKYDIYAGLRCVEELEESARQGLFDYLIAVDGRERLPEEPKTSFTIPLERAEYILDNNGSLSELPNQVKMLADWIVAKETEKKTLQSS